MIGEAWASYLTNVVPAAASDAQREELKRAFYAGAAAMYDGIFTAVDGDGGELERLEAIDRELADYLRLFKAREGIKP